MLKVARDIVEGEWESWQMKKKKKNETTTDTPESFHAKLQIVNV